MSMGLKYRSRRRRPAPRWRVKWTAAEVDRLRELKAAGQTARQIAAALRRSVGAVVDHCIRLRLTRGRWRYRSAHERAETERMILAGVKFKVIAARFGRTVNSVRGYAARAGLTVPPDTANRRRLLLTLFRKHRQATAVQLARLLGVHPATVRVDFEALGLRHEYERRYRNMNRKRTRNGDLTRDRDTAQRADSARLGYPPVLAAYRPYLDVIGRLGEATPADVAAATGMERVCAAVGLGKLHRDGHVARVRRVACRRTPDSRPGGSTWVYRLSDEAAALRAAHAARRGTEADRR